MRYRCPYCCKPAKKINAKKFQIAEDGEMFIATCEFCRKDFSVSLIITELSIMETQHLELEKDLKELPFGEAIQKYFGRGNA